jgi:hypothetical protein
LQHKLVIGGYTFKEIACLDGHVDYTHVFLAEEVEGGELLLVDEECVGMYDG